MSDLHWLTDEQMAWLEQCFPKNRGRPRGMTGACYDCCPTAFCSAIALAATVIFRV